MATFCFSNRKYEKSVSEVTALMLEARGSAQIQENQVKTLEARSVQIKSELDAEKEKCKELKAAVQVCDCSVVRKRSF